MEVLQKAQNILQEQGIKGLTQRLIRKLIYRRQSIVLLKHDLHKPHKQYKVSKRWTVRQFTEPDLALCRTYFNRYLNDYRDLFRENYKAFAAFEANTDEVIAIAWYAHQDFYDQHYHHYTFKVAPHQVFQFAGEVRPDYRNTQISINVMQAAWSYWKQQGKDEVCCSVDTTNIPSLRLVLHVDWEETGELVHFHRLLGYRWTSEEIYSGERFAHYKKRKRRANSENTRPDAT